MQATGFREFGVLLYLSKIKIRYHLTSHLIMAQKKGVCKTNFFHWEKKLQPFSCHSLGGERGGKGTGLGARRGTGTEAADGAPRGPVRPSHHPRVTSLRRGATQLTRHHDSPKRFPFLYFEIDSGDF